MTLLRRMWRYFRQPLSMRPSNSDDDALNRAWIRDQILEARIRLLEREILEDGRDRK